MVDTFQTTTTKKMKAVGEIGIEMLSSISAYPHYQFLFTQTISQQHSSTLIFEDTQSMTTTDVSPSEEVDTKTKTIFSKYYEYLPYMRPRKESILCVLYSRETGMSSSFARKNNNQSLFYTRSLCAAKFKSSEQQPLVHSVTNENKSTKVEEQRRLRPRQFEYHPSDPSLMAVGTLDGDVLVMNHITGNVASRLTSDQDMNGVLGLCWLKHYPSKLLVGSDNGSLRLYDSSSSPSMVNIFDDFERLTSVNVNSTDERFLVSGYSEAVAIYDLCSGKRLQLLEGMHRGPINVAKFSNHSPSLFVTSSFDGDVKMWDSRRKPAGPCYSVSSSRGNVMAVFSPDDLYLLVSAVDNEVKQLLAGDGRLHTDFGIVSTGSAQNYTRSYYMNGRDYIISGSCQESTVRVCCAQTGRRLRDISLEDTTRQGSSVSVQSLRSDPFRHFDMAILGTYGHPISKHEIIKVNLLSSTNSDQENQGDIDI